MDLKRNFLFDILPKNCVCAEVGVWKGDFSQEILNHLNPQKLYLVDPWLFQPTYVDSWYGGGEAKSQEDMDVICSKVHQRFIRNCEVEISRKSSVEASKMFPDDYFDFVYIDSCHLYEYAIQDLKVWYEKIKNGGFLVGDDYNAPTGWWKDGVTKAVNEFVETNKLILSIRNNQFIIEKGR